MSTLADSNPPANSAHEWISFDDEDGATWMFDATFLLSPWTCIFGSGCKGVLTEDASDMQQGCCSYGAHFADSEDRATVKKAAKRLDDSTWQFRTETLEAGGPITKNDDGDWVTRQVEDACCFLNRPDFEGGPGCALHSVAVSLGERPLDWKPDVCWQLPLRLTHETDANGYITYTLREWKRRDWGEGGDEFHWWCTESSDAFVGATRVYEHMADEIIELVGEAPYRWFVDFAQNRPTGQQLPHPAIRTRGQGHHK